jgi:TonB family protein
MGVGLGQNISLPGFVGGITGPVPIQKTDPEYSEEARAAGLEGTVTLSGMIGADGFMRDPQVTGPLGLGLDEKAVEAVRQWKFTPWPVTWSVGVDFVLPSKQSRWHLIQAAFETPPGASRPVFASANYPRGPGIRVTVFDEGRIIQAIGRQAFVRLSFDVDEQGTPVHFQVKRASLALWGEEAIAVVRAWRFQPAMKNGIPVSVPCTLDLGWGATTLSSSALTWLRSAMNQPPQQHLYRVEIRGTGSEYPEAALNAGLEGTVTVYVLVEEDGTRKDVRALTSLGLGLDEKAVEIASTFNHFAPITPGPVIVDVIFRLH